MVARENKNKTVRVTEKEKLLLNLYRDIDEEYYDDNLLYRRSQLTKEEILYSNKIEFILKELSKDELLKICYEIAKEDIGEILLYKRLSVLTDSLIYGIFQTNIEANEIPDREKKNLLSSNTLKDTIAYIYCTDKELCLKAMKEYLLRHYAEKGKIVIEERQEILKKKYIDIVIKKHQIPILLSLTEAAKDIEEDMFGFIDYEYYEEDDKYDRATYRHKINIRFYNELIDVLKSHKNTFPLKVHAVFFSDIFLSIVESSVDSAKYDVEGIKFALLDNIYFDCKEPNKSAKQLKKEGIIICNMYDYLKDVITENEKICDYYEDKYEYILNEEPLLIVAKDSLKSNKVNNRRRLNSWK